MSKKKNKKVTMTSSASSPSLDVSHEALTLLTSHLESLQTSFQQVASPFDASVATNSHRFAQICSLPMTMLPPPIQKFLTVLRPSAGHGPPSSPASSLLVVLVFCECTHEAGCKCSCRTVLHKRCRTKLSRNMPKVDRCGTKSHCSCGCENSTPSPIFSCPCSSPPSVCVHVDDQCGGGALTVV